MIIARNSGGERLMKRDGRGRFSHNIFVERLWRSLKYEEALFFRPGPIQRWFRREPRGLRSNRHRP